MKNFKYPFSIITIILLTSITCFGQKDSLKTNTRTLPFAMHLIEDSNVDFPLPFGVSVFFAYQSRGVDIHNVEVAFQDEAKQSINDFANFDLNNKSTVSAIKLDAWLLPFVNIYGMLGSVSTNASLDATITIDRVLPGPPIVIPISNQSKINGIYYGLGTTMVAGYANWFILGDVNYGYSKINEFDGKIDFWMFSARSGMLSKVGKNNLKTWVGAMYLSSNRTLHLNVENEIMGLIQVDVHQQTVNPWTIQLGTSLSLGKHFEILMEMGTNFDDSSIGVLTSSYRF